MQIEENSKLEFLCVDNCASTAIILLHGYGANFQDLFGLNEYLNPDSKHTFICINAPIKLAMSPFFDSRAWFPINEQELMEAQRNNRHRLFRDQYPKEMQLSLDRLTKCIQSLIEKYKLKKIILGGFSQGAMMSLHFAFSYPMVIEKLILYSAGFIGERELSEKLNTFENQFPIFQSHGEEDPILSFNEAKDLSEFLINKNIDLKFYPFPGVHEIPLKILNTSRDFILN